MDNSSLRRSIRRVMQAAANHPGDFIDSGLSWTRWEHAFDAHFDAVTTMGALCDQTAQYLLFKNWREAAQAIQATLYESEQEPADAITAGQALLALITEATRVHVSNTRFYASHPHFSEWVKAGLPGTLEEFEAQRKEA